MGPFTSDHREILKCILVQAVGDYVLNPRLNSQGRNCFDAWMFCIQLAIQGRLVADICFVGLFFCEGVYFRFSNQCSAISRHWWWDDVNVIRCRYLAEDEISDPLKTLNRQSNIPRSVRLHMFGMVDSKGTQCSNGYGITLGLPSILVFPQNCLTPKCFFFNVLTI